MSSYIGWETSISLLLAYETLAKNHVKTLRLEPNEEGADEPHAYFKYKNAFALLILMHQSLKEPCARFSPSE